jgi:hypothetical protein
MKKSREALEQENMELRLANKLLIRLIRRTDKMETKFKNDLTERIRQESTCRRLLLDKPRKA